MKYSYPDSLITLTAAITEACSLCAGKRDNPGTQHKKNPSHPKLNTNKPGIENRVGIKFDYVLARKYFILIHTTQQRFLLKKILEKSDATTLKDSPVTTCNNEWIRVYDRNGPIAGCQSTFLKTTS
ncbi:MAG: hypothetical protein IPI68_06355 [Chitinophagaceae bacterium]|nr:hypothetical protein [Chitinophagaceae bacterium]